MGAPNRLSAMKTSNILHWSPWPQHAALARGGAEASVMARQRRESQPNMSPQHGCPLHNNAAGKDWGHPHPPHQIIYGANKHGLS